MAAAATAPIARAGRSHQKRGCAVTSLEDEDTAQVALPFKHAQRRRAFEEVIVQIENAIAQGNYRAGDRLPNERALAEMIGVGRGSVREALRVLEGFGVLAAKPGRGAQSGSVLSAENNSGLVSVMRLYISLRRIPLGDLFAVRRSLEELVTRAAAETGAPDHICRLDEIATLMAEQSDVDQFFVLDAEFHLTIAAASQNVLAPLIMEALAQGVSESMKGSLMKARLDDVDGRSRMAHQHHAIAERIAARDPEGAVDAMGAHLDSSYARLVGQER
jgi:GntR family transcriptional regulator, transcriptional repressor for pyruvate dehydrogenase complex